MESDLFIARLLLMLAALILMAWCGLGLALITTRTRQGRVIDALLLSAPIGCGLIGLLLEILSLAFNLPIQSTALPVTLVCALFSAALSAIDFIRRRADYLLRVGHASLTAFVAAMLGVFLLVVIPMRVGGYPHTLYQGNAWDAFYYIALGGNMKFASADAAKHPTEFAALLEEYPAASNIRSLAAIHRKLSASILAWMSALSGLPIYRVFFPFSTLCLLLTWLAALAVTRLLDLPLIHQHAAALITSIGFWAFLIFDINATSQLNAMPLMLVFSYAWIQFEANPNPLISRERVLLGFSIAAMFRVYPESTAVAVAGFVLYIAVKFYHRPNLSETIQTAAKHLFTALIAAIWLGPTLDPTIRYLIYQRSEAPTAPNSWAISLYPFFLTENNRAFEALTGLWGGYLLHPINLGITHPLIATPLLGFLYGLSALLTLILLFGLVMYLRRPHDDHRFNVLMTLALTYWGGALAVIILRDRYYIGGKAVGMGFIAVYLTLFLIARDLPDLIQRHRRALTLGLTVLLMAWVGVNLIGSVFRVYAVVTHRPIASYQPLVWPDLAVLDDVQSTLADQPITLLAADLSTDPRVPSAALDMMLSEDYDYLPLEGVGGYWGNRPRGWLDSDTLPDVLVIEQPTSSANYVAQAGAGRELYTDRFFAIYQMTPTDYDALLHDVSALIPDARQPVKFMTTRWQRNFDPSGALILADGEVELYFLASGEAQIALTVIYEADVAGNLQITANQQTAVSLTVPAGETITETMCFAPRTGTNRIVLTASVNDAMPHILLHKLLISADSPACP